MGNFKENLKKHWKNLLLICVVLLCVIGAVVGIVLHRLNAEEAVSQIYTVEVKDENGKSIEEVYVTLCAEDGTEISWLPYVTGITGEARITQGMEDGCYVKVVGVPMGYKLDESVKHLFDENGNVTIILGEDDSAYVAQIGDNKYFSFATALGAANASSDDVVIDLLCDITIKTGTINNTYGKTITINGNGHTLTTEAGNNAFLINQEEGIVAFENMTIKHKNTGSVLQINTLATVNMTDVVLDATEGTAYNYALINTMAVDGTTTLNLTRVDAKMAVGSPAKADQAGIIRTGNTTGTKTVNINLVDCNFDTEGATGRQCIVVMKNTVANITATNCTFKSGDSYAILAEEQTKMQTLTLNNCQAVSTVSPYSATPIKGYAARIGNTYYLTLDHAAQIANASKNDSVITVVTDVTMKTCAINNKYGKLVTVDGAGRTITTEKGNNAFVVGKNVAFKNMTINHKNTGSVIQVTEVANVTATDVIINATEGETYNFTLVNTLAGGSTTTLNFTRVKATMAVETEAKSSYAGIIMTGNASEDTDVKTVVMNLVDCVFDTTKAAGRCGIGITGKTTATVNLTNTKITTKDAFAIRSNKQDINWNNADTTLTSLTQQYIDYPVEYYLAKIGDVFYTFEEALDVANKATTDTTINMLANYTIKTNTASNTNGKLITINGNGKKITTSGGNNALVVGRNVTINNMTIDHKNYGSAVQVDEAGTITLNDVVINAISGSEYRYALINVMATGETTLNLNRVNATMSVAGAGRSSNSAIVRTGNNDTKTVNLNVTDCNFDTVKATGRSGIIVMKGTTANMNLKNTTIHTLNAAPIKSNESSAAQKIVKENCTLASDTAEFQDEPIRGYDAQVGNVVYNNFKEALAAANASSGDVTIELLQDFTVGANNDIKNGNGAAITINGNGKTVTATGGNNTFRVNDPQTGAVAINNMTIVQNNVRNAVQVRTKAIVNLTDVTIDATQGEKYEYSLIAMEASGTLNLTGVKATMAVASEGNDDYAAIIRTGNAGQDKEVEINLVGCMFDTTEAIGRNGVMIMEGTKATVRLEGTKIKTMNASAIRTAELEEGQATVSDDSELVCGKKANELDGYVIRIGNTWYVGYGSSLVEAVQNATEDITITLSTDMTIDLDEFKNNNGNKVTIDVNGNCLTTTGTKDASVEIVSEAHIIVGEQTLYVDMEDVVETANNATADVRIEVLSDWEVYLTDINNVNGNSITIDSNGNCLTTTGTLRSTVAILSEAQMDVGTITFYLDFVDAVAKANESSEAVTIYLLDDIIVKQTQAGCEYTINQSVTIEGNNHTLTTEGDVNNVFRVYKNGGVIELKNMTINHQGYGAVVQVWYRGLDNSAFTDEISVKLTDVDINATTPQGAKGCEYAIINTRATSKIELTRVNVEMHAPANTRTEKAVIRTGNANEAKTVNITLADSTLDTTDATGRSGIVIMNGTTANIDMTDSSIDTLDTVPIMDCPGNSTISKTRCTLNCKNFDAQIGNELYTSFAEAFAAASEGDTIEMLDNLDITVAESGCQYKINQSITIDGNAHIITTATNISHVFRVYKSGATVGFKNMTINHNGSGSVIQVWYRGLDNSAHTEEIVLNLTDVNINAKEPGNGGYTYLINTRATSSLNLTRVNVEMDITSTGTNQSFIYTGNKSDPTNTVNINLSECKLDATEATGRSGILVMGGKTVNIALRDKTEILVGADCAVVGNVDGSAASTTVTITDDCVLQSGTSTTLTDIIKNIDVNNNVSVVPGNVSTTASVSLDEEQTETKTLILEVPMNLYDALVDWIKQFATKNGWDLAL